MRLCSLVLTASALVFAVNTPAHAGDCPGTPGYVLDLPDTVELGSTFDICMQAPGGSLVFILVSADPGPLQTKYGPLCVNVPFIALWPLIMPDNGALCLVHDMNCDENLVGFTGHFQFAAFGPGSTGVGLSNGQSLTAVNSAQCIDKGDFWTFTQGGCGTKCAGGNPGCLRDQWFDTIFPGSLIVGDQDGPDADNLFALELTSSLAVENFLPDGGTGQALDADELDVANSSAHVLAGQLVAAKLNVNFDAGGAFDNVKNQLAMKLGDLVFVGGVDSDLLGESVNDVIALTDKAISGEIAEPFDVDGDLVGDVSFSDLVTALTVVNENFDNGNSNNGNLGPP